MRLENARLLKINRVLMDRVERANRSRISDFAIFEDNILLQQRIEQRTGELLASNRYLEELLSEQKAISDELRKSRQILRGVVDSIPRYIFWKDINSVYLGCNVRFAERRLGVPEPSLIVGKTDYDIAFSAEEAEVYRAHDQAVMLSCQAEYNLIENQTDADGNKVLLNCSKLPLFDAKGTVIGVLGMYQVVSEEMTAAHFGFETAH